ncbi:MAG: UDP-N-acetylglucosamine 2-epimerase (non-hydrolyzing) [Euryarchaeota archaeon]|nr:UDP-N-acetylglucosamine 2-epimerase (non-hydrolyzing) [Euryarchaeota archaeon]
MKVAVVLGTRPEIIKMAPVIKALDARGVTPILIHTGQHYSYEMDRLFFEDLALPEADHNLEVGSGRQGEQTGRMLARIETTLLDEAPDAVLVQGDTNTVLAGALAAAKLLIPIGHVEAGLRSFDRTMPEELNRILADHLSTWLFAPTPRAAAQLAQEGIPDRRVSVTGNTIVDAVHYAAERAATKSAVLGRLGLTGDGYLLLTAHRQENVDDRHRFAGILKGAAQVGDALGHEVVYPIHPRARKMLEGFGLDTSSLRLIEPVGFLDFLELERNARLVLTDSGGVQEESCILGVPCVTLRDNTERPETVDVGGNVLAGTDPERIVRAAKRMSAVIRGWDNPFGDGHASERIARAVMTGPPDTAPEGKLAAEGTT